MDKKFQNYIEEVIDNIGISGKKREQIREDLYTSLIEKQQITGESDPYSLLGSPYEVAKEFRENLDIECNTNNYFRYRYGFEYVSKTKVFGVPLVHINSKPLGVAKGIFSIGTVAIGLVSLGAVSIGVLSFGAIALAVIMAVGGAAFSGMLSIGGLAISYVASIGGAAIAKYISVGGYARADIARGGVTNGIVSVFEQHGTGRYLFKVPANADKVITAIKKVYPHMSKSILDLIKLFI